MINYEATPDEIKDLAVNQLTPEDLQELAYYLWCCLAEDESLMIWREQRLLPLVRATAEQLPEENR